MESSIFVLDPIKGEFWHFKVERRVLTSGTVISQTVNLIGSMKQDISLDCVECELNDERKI